MRFFGLILLVVAISCNSQSADKRIVLINVDTLGRVGIANVLSKINEYDPKVIAIDLQFSSHTNYSDDNYLIQVLDEIDNLVMVSVIEDYTGTSAQYKRFARGSLEVFLLNARTGFANTIHENDGYQTLRRFSIMEKVNNEIEYHFSVRTAMVFDSLQTVKFITANPNRIVDVDYHGGRSNFKTFSSSEVLMGRIGKGDVQGKIVLIGFLGPGDEDKFFTPLNKGVPPLEPDMYGLEYLANIVAQVLEYEAK